MTDYQRKAVHVVVNDKTDKIVGVFSNRDAAVKYCDDNDPDGATGYTLGIIDFKVNELVDDSGKE